MRRPSPLATLTPTAALPRDRTGPDLDEQPISTNDHSIFYYVTEPGGSCGKIKPFFPTRHRPTVRPFSRGRRRSTPVAPGVPAGMVQLRVTAITEVAIHWNSGFRRFRDRLDAKLRRRESIEYLKRQHGRKFTSMIHPETPVIERCPICHESQTKILMDPGPVGDRVLSLPLASLICVPLRNLRTRIRDVISNRIWDLRCWPVDHFWLTVPGAWKRGRS